MIRVLCVLALVLPMVALGTAARAATPPGVADSSLDSTWNDYGDDATCGDWSGGDATNSIVLPNGERAWFFSDTFLGSPASRKTLFDSSFIRNSIVVQNGSSMQTITGGNTCQEPSGYADTPATTSGYAFDWTGDQIVDGSNLIKFYYGGNSLTTSSTFTGEVATIPLSGLESPNTDSAGNPMITISPQTFNSCTGGTNVVWGASLLNYGGYIYVYGWVDPAHEVYLARTELADLANTDFSGWQFYDAGSFSSSCADATPLNASVPEHDADFSVDQINGDFWLTEDNGTDIVSYPSSTPWGFTASAVTLYTPPEDSNTGDPYYEVHYGGRLQPGLTDSSGDYVVSYNVNTQSVDTGCVSANVHDADIYRPRFVDVPSSAFTASDATAATARAGDATATNGSIDGSTDWFNSADYSTGCPPIPAASGLSAAAQSNGTVTLSWANAGTDVWYYGYQCDASTSACAEASTACQAGSGYSQMWGGLWVEGSPGTAPSETVSPTPAGNTFDWYVCSFGAANPAAGGNSNAASAVVP